MSGKICLLYCVALIAAACSAPTPTPSGPNITWIDTPILPLPPSFVSRNHYEDASGIYKYEPTELVGQILAAAPGQTTFVRKGILLPKDFKPSLQVFTDTTKTLIYDGLISGGVAGEVKTIAATLNLSGTALATLQIQDRYGSWIPNQQAPWPELIAQAQMSKTVSAKRYWVQGVLVTSIDFVRATEVGVGGSVQVSEAFSANGKVYQKSTAKSHEYMMSLLLIDLDQLEERDYILQTLPSTSDKTVSELNTVRDLVTAQDIDRIQSILPPALTVDNSDIITFNRYIKERIEQISPQRLRISTISDTDGG